MRLLKEELHNVGLSNIEYECLRISTHCPIMLNIKLFYDGSYCISNDHSHL